MRSAVIEVECISKKRSRADAANPLNNWGAGEHITNERILFIRLTVNGRLLNEHTIAGRLLTRTAAAALQFLCSLASSMSRVEPDQFIKEVVSYYKQVSNVSLIPTQLVAFQSRLGGSQAVTLTIKPCKSFYLNLRSVLVIPYCVLDDGRTKPEPRPDKRPKNPPKPENLCLVRAKINKTHVSTVVRCFIIIFVTIGCSYSLFLLVESRGVFLSARE